MNLPYFLNIFTFLIYIAIVKKIMLEGKYFMYMKIENIPSCKIAYLRRIGPYGMDNKEIMEELKSWAKSNGFLNGDSIVLGIPQDDPQMTAPEACRYDTCVVVPQHFEATGERIRSGNIPGGKYASFKIKHNEAALKKAWTDIFPELTKKELSLDISRPILERYSVRSVENHYCEICVPVQ